MKRSNLSIMMRLIKLVKPLTHYMLLAIMMGVIGNLCATFITIFAGFGVLHAVDRGAPFNLTTLLILMIVLAIVRAVLKYAEQGCNHYIAFRLLALIRDHVFKALRKLTPAKLETKDKGNLVSLITTDIELLEVFYAHTVSPIAIAFIYTIIMVTFIAHYHKLLGLLALLSYLCVGVAIPLISSMKSDDVGERVRGGAANLSTFVLDSMRGLRETLQYNGGLKRLSEMHDMTDSLLEDQKDANVLASKNRAMTISLITIFGVVMLLAGILLYDKGEVGFREIFITTIALMSSFGPVSSLAALGTTLANTFASGNRVLDILDEKPITEEVFGKEDVGFNGAKVNDISFEYEEGEVLKDFSIGIAKNKITGIVGKSGSGKSTLLKLLMRFWDVKNGNIEISGKDIKEVNTSNLRDLESYMTQDTFLFHDTIKNNIKIAKLDASDEEIIEACKKASIHNFIISLPNGYDSEVAELGDSLSGGEKQRIGLARVFLHDAPFILLDEPTSNLDSLNEGVILKSLKEESDNKTVVLVSHRESTMRIVDEKYTVDSGRLS